MNFRLGARRILFATLALFAIANGMLIYAPVAAGHASLPARGCTEQTPAGSQGCPCCPDDAGAMTGCLSHCAAQVLESPAMPGAMQVPGNPEIPYLSVELAHTAFPPPDPPPIR